MLQVKKYRICGDLKTFMNDEPTQSDDCINLLNQETCETSIKIENEPIAELVEELAA